MIGVIADDLTGAAELGAIGLRHGLRAEILIDSEATATADLVCIDTDSRLCPPAEAGRRARVAVSALQVRGADWIFKKTDSALRGNVAPEIESILDQLHLREALLVPANPSLGRTIVDGRYYLHGRPIHETEFGKDPKHPRKSPNVLDLIEPGFAVPVNIAKPGESLPANSVVMGEAARAADVRRWADYRHPSRLLAGGAEFFAALLAPGLPITQTIPRMARALWLCGSASDATQSFVAAQSRRGVPVFGLPEKLAVSSSFLREEAISLAVRVAAGFQASSRVILQVGLPRVTDEHRAEGLVAHLVEVAVEVLHRSAPSHVFAEGGATAVALARRMGWGRLAVRAELAPGVALLSPVGAGAVEFVIKPGSYSWPETLVNANAHPPVFP